MYCLMCRKKINYIRELNYNADLYYCEDCDIEYPTAKELKKNIECPFCQYIYTKQIKEYANISCKKCNNLYHVESKYYVDKLIIGYYISKKVE